MKFSFYIIALFFTFYALPTQAQIEWISIDQLAQRMDDEPRKVLVKIYTENCNWCKRMDEETFEQAYVAEYVDEYYYAVALDANTQDEITFKGKSYKYSKSGKLGRHELAVELTKGNLSYPSVVFLDDQLNVLQSVSGYKPYPLFQQIMTYYGKDFHTRIPWSSYQSTYVPKKD